MEVSICVFISPALRRHVFVETGSMPDSMWSIDIDVGDFDREERRHLLRMSRWLGEVRLRPTSPELNEHDIKPNERLYVKSYTPVASSHDAHIRGNEYEIDVTPKHDLERTAVDAYFAAMGVKAREDAPSEIDAARALVRLDAQLQAEAFREFRQAMIEHVRAFVEEGKTDDRLMIEFLREEIRQCSNEVR